MESEERTMRTSRGTAVRIVTELMDVETSFGVGIIAADVVGDGGGTGFGRLLKGHGPRDFRVSSKDGDYRWVLPSISLLTDNGMLRRPVTRNRNRGPSTRLEGCMEND